MIYPSRPIFDPHQGVTPRDFARRRYGVRYLRTYYFCQSLVVRHPLAEPERKEVSR